MQGQLQYTAPGAGSVSGFCSIFQQHGLIAGYPLQALKALKFQLFSDIVMVSRDRQKRLSTCGSKSLGDVVQDHLADSFQFPDSLFHAWVLLGLFPLQ